MLGYCRSTFQKDRPLQVSQYSRPPFDINKLVPAVDSLPFCCESTGIRFFQDGRHNLFEIGARMDRGTYSGPWAPTAKIASKLAHGNTPIFRVAESERRMDGEVPFDRQHEIFLCP